MTLTRPLEALRDVDPSWDFRGEFTADGGYTHALHSYPAMMIPAVARRLIAEHAPISGVVLDPFCGSGGVLLEALLAGHSAWGIDLNPIGVLISRVKATPLDPAALETACTDIIDRATNLLPRPSLALPESFNPAFSNLSFWFKPDVIRALAALRAAILDLDEPSARNFFAVALSQTARLASNSRREEFKLYRYPAEKLAAHRPDPFALFEERARRNCAAMASLARARPFPQPVRLLLADAAQASRIPAGTVDLVVTSPPYGDSHTTVAYGQFSRLSAQWLYPDLLPAPPVQDRHLLGGRPDANLDDRPPSDQLARVLAAIAAQDERRAREVLAFYRDFFRCLGPIARSVRQGGTLCFVVGNRRVKGTQLPTDLIVAELGCAIGLTPLRIVVREIPAKRMPLRNSPSNVAGAVENTMHQEYIVILRREENASPPHLRDEERGSYERRRLRR